MKEKKQNQNYSIFIGGREYECMDVNVNVHVNI